MKKILLFPGAFNPPHYGHMEIIELALGRVHFDELWIMPSGRRQDKAIGTDYEDRRALGNLFVEYVQSKLEIPVKLMTAELDDPGARFTHDIIKEVKASPDVEITQLMGLDAFIKHKHKINDAQEKLIVLMRMGHRVPLDLAHAQSLFIDDVMPQTISSTQIRAMVKDGDPQLPEFLPEKIAAYIEKHRLYI